MYEKCVDWSQGSKERPILNWVLRPTRVPWMLPNGTNHQIIQSNHSMIRTIC
jgi:hypothetical protein